VTPTVSKHDWTQSVSQTVRKSGARASILCQLATPLGGGHSTTTPGKGDLRPSPNVEPPGWQTDMVPYIMETTKPTHPRGGDEGGH